MVDILKQRHAPSDRDQQRLAVDVRIPVQLDDEDLAKAVIDPLVEIQEDEADTDWGSKDESYLDLSLDSVVVSIADEARDGWGWPVVLEHHVCREHGTGYLESGARADLAWVDEALGVAVYDLEFTR